MKIFITGCDGYIGWPTILKLLKEFPDATIMGFDNLDRRKWVEEVGAKSLLKIASMNTRNLHAIDIFKPRKGLCLNNVDFRNTESVYNLIRKEKPDIILHLASQPSAPYSQISIRHCNSTQEGNTRMLRNIIWAMKDFELKNTHLIITTTTGVYGSANIKFPEGNLNVNGEELPYPSMGTSWYHMSRAFDAANLWLSSIQFDLNISEFRTSIVCGSSTEETRMHSSFNTRFDADFYFGVVCNRFAVQALKGEPITIYGKGDQSKPMISLEDTCRSLVEACKIDVKKRDKKYEIYNQLEKCISIKDLAYGIKKSFNDLGKDIEVKHIANPRVENETAKLEFENDKFVNLIGGTFRKTLEESISDICCDLTPHIDSIRGNE